MAEIIRKTQEEEVILMLKREGFRELSKQEVEKEPYKTFYERPECFNIANSKEPINQYLLSKREMETK